MRNKKYFKRKSIFK